MLATKRYRWSTRWFARHWCGLALLSVLLVSLPPSQAQVRLDGSLGPQGPLNGPHYTIPATAGQQRGPNLFHSFSHFNVGVGESATFTGPNTVQHILSRVTGGQPTRTLTNSVIPQEAS